MKIRYNVFFSKCEWHGHNDAATVMQSIVLEMRAQHIPLLSAFGSAGKNVNKNKWNHTIFGSGREAK